MASRRDGTVYTGMTTDLSRRIYEHRGADARGLHQAARLHAAGLVGAGTLNLIEAENPEWSDLYERLNG